jgi:hypothetical protein
MKTANWLFSLMVCGALACLSTRATTLYVWQESPSPASPFTNWTAAAHTIQDAVDAASAGDTVLVTNGVYASVSVNKSVTLTSVDGPATTVVDGGGTNRCVWLGTNAFLKGFTLTNGSADSGGGVWCESTNAEVTGCTVLLRQQCVRD